MSELSLEDQIEQLNSAKRLVENDPQHYPIVVQSILSIAQRPQLPLREWCSGFLVDAFTLNNTVMDIEVKKALALECLDTILIMLKDTATSSSIVIKNAITTASCLYPLVFAYICENQGSDETWNKLIDMKRLCLNHWNNSNTGKRHFGILASCIKFAQQVISVQSYGSRDPRVADPDDISLSSAPPGHPLIEPPLEAEAYGLLDKLLFTFSEHELLAPKFTGTINAMYPLIKSRSNMAQKIIKVLLNFDSSTKALIPGSSGVRAELEYKFVDKCLELLLRNVLRHNFLPKYAPNIQRYLSTLSQGRASEKLKRRLTQSEPLDGSNKKQRVKLEQSTIPINSSTTMSQGLNTYTSLFTLISPDDLLLSFDAKELPPEMAVNIALAGIATVNPELLQNSIKVVNDRYQSLLDQHAKPDPAAAAQYPLDSYPDENDESDYEPVDISPAKLKIESQQEEQELVESEDEEEGKNLQPASSFSLPPPQKLPEQQKLKEIGNIVERLISYSNIGSSKAFSSSSNANKGINRIAVSEWNNDTWVILASRMVTRGMCGTNQAHNQVVREHMFRYIMGNFRERLDIVVLWMTEEWYHEQVTRASSDSNNKEGSEYLKWTSQFLDQIIPLMDMDDSKGFIRLLSDLPELTRSMIQKLRSLCIDPERAQIGYRTIRFLIMLRPPVKEMCLDLLEELYKNDDSAKQSTASILKKYRPQVVQ